MKIVHVASIAAAVALTATLPLAAQTKTETKVSHDSKVADNGVVTDKTKVTHTTKHKTRHAKKVLGVKVGHKTVTHKTERETSVSSNGDTSTTVKTK